MTQNRGERLPPIRDLIRIGPPVTERMALDAKPAWQILGSYVLTRAATESWQIINRQLEKGVGALFWINGSGGSGKTHFLNYVLALDRKAGAPALEQRRRITLAIEAARSSSQRELQAQFLELLACELSASKRVAMLWRETGGSAATEAALSEAKRIGIRAVTVGLDFALGDPLREGFEFLENLAVIAARVKGLQFTVLAAGRGPAPAQATALEVGAVDRDEQWRVAIGRARQITNQASGLLGTFYQGMDLASFEPEDVFPFHPASVAQLQRLANPPGTVASIAKLIQEVLALHPDASSEIHRRLIFPCDLFQAPEISRGTNSRLGEAGRAAIKKAQAALAALDKDEAVLGSKIIATLVLEYLCGTAPALDLSELRARIPEASSDVAPLVERIADLSSGAIQVAAKAARFEPLVAGSHALAVFNNGLPVAKLFDPTLTPAEQDAELQAKLNRLGKAMAAALEAAHYTGETLTNLIEQMGAELDPEYFRAIADFSAIAAAGPSALLEAASDQQRREGVTKAVSQYEIVARAAAAAPRLRAMREYLEATSLLGHVLGERSADQGILRLETECKLLSVELGPRVLFENPLILEALEARFNRFKWTYAQRYQEAHSQWRAEMARLAEQLKEANRYLQALARLDSIQALGPPQGAGLATLMKELNQNVVPCTLDGGLAPDLDPRCTRCGLVLGAPVAQREVEEALEQIRSALRFKFEALSRNAIAQIIKRHDRSGRLDGFIKIVQAAQTEALVRVLDDKLVRYLSDLLEKSSDAERKVIKLDPARKAGGKSRGRS